MITRASPEQNRNITVEKAKFIDAKSWNSEIFFLFS